MTKWRIGAAATMVGVVVGWGGLATPAHAQGEPTAQTVAPQQFWDDDSGNGPVRPMLECVAINGDGTYTAVFGSSNPSNKARTEPIGLGNFFWPGEPNRGQPTRFGPDRTVASFSVTFSTPILNWTLNGRTTVASPRSQPCNSAPSVSEAGMPAALAGMLALTGGGWMWRRRQIA